MNNPLEVCPYCFFEFRRNDCVQIDLKIGKPLFVCAPCVKSNGLTPREPRTRKSDRKRAVSFTVPAYLTDALDTIEARSHSAAVVLALTAFQTNAIPRISEDELTAQWENQTPGSRPRSCISYSLTFAHCETLRTIGDGNRSLGLERVLASLYAATHKPGTQATSKPASPVAPVAPTAEVPDFLR